MDYSKIPNWKPGLLELSYDDIRKISTAYNLLEEDRFNVEPVLVHFQDGVCVLPRRRVMWCILFWGMLTSYNKPITMRNHIFPIYGVMNVKVIQKIHTFLYQELIQDPNIDPDHVRTTLWEHINELNRFTIRELAEYQETASMYDFALIAEDPIIKELVEGDVPMIKGIPYIEHRIVRIENELAELLGTRGALKNNALYQMQATGVLNPGQVRQMFGPMGVKTDVNESVILHYIPYSVVHGMRSIEDYITESFSARKAAFYTHDAIEKSQYFGRQLHLTMSTIRKVYANDCGSKNYIQALITDENYKNFEGKNIVVGNKMINLNRHNLESYIGDVVHLRSPITCLHTDGICKVCGGALMDYISNRLDIGIMAAISLVEPTSQKILSTKHYANTSSVGYKLNPIAEDFLSVENNNIYFKQEWIDNSEKWLLGIPHDNIRSMHDLLHIDGSMNIRERIFSTMSNMVIRDRTDNIREIPLAVGNTIPFLTKKALLYLKTRYNEVTKDDEYIWIPMDGLKDMKRFPFLKTVVINDSMMAFVDSITSFLKKNIVGYKSASVALEDFSKLVYAKVEVNVMHLEILLKAFVVTSKGDYTTPLVTDPESVIFAKMGDIITNRTIGGEFAFERLKKYFSSVDTYVVPKSESPMDKLVGL